MSRKRLKIIKIVIDNKDYEEKERSVEKVEGNFTHRIL